MLHAYPILDQIILGASSTFSLKVKTTAMFLPNCATAYALLLALSQLCLIRCAHIPTGFLVPQDHFPLNSSDTSEQLMRRDITDAEKERLNQLSNSYKGIYWQTAYPGAGTENGGCTVLFLTRMCILRSLIRNTTD
jgi:hypothetical protein